MEELIRYAQKMLSIGDVIICDSDNKPFICLSFGDPYCGGGELEVYQPEEYFKSVCYLGWENDLDCGEALCLSYENSMGQKFYVMHP